MNRAVALVGVALVALATTALVLHVPSCRLVSHVVSIHLALADLLERGVLYPREASDELLYATFYQPLAFGPLALLPGRLAEKLPALRMLIGAECLLCLALVWQLARSFVPAAAVICTAPFCFCLLGMRDDPRATLACLLALLASARGRHSLAALCLALAFFTKITAPFAPGIALLYACARISRRAALRFALACAALVAVPSLILHFGLATDFLGNGLRHALLEPAFQPRGALVALKELLKDLCAVKERAFGLAPLVLASALGICAQLRRRRLDMLDVLVLATWAKCLLAYRNPGADYNHLFDLALFSALHAHARWSPLLTPAHTLLALALLFALDRPYELLLGEARPPLSATPALRVAAALRGLDRQPTLCEDALVALSAGLAPVVPDAGLVAAAWRRHPELRARWFGPADRPGALQRIVLIHDPFDTARPELARHWYSVVNYDAEFFAELERGWTVAMRGPDATVLVRR